MSSESRRLPAGERDAVVRALYADADRVGWEHLTPQARTAQYDRWVTEAQIGEVLTAYMGAENARSWIKDGPMKEYKRARQGAGRYARFGSSNGISAAEVASHAFGDSAVIVERSLGVKPTHCAVMLPGEVEAYLAWGEANHFRYLVWACLSYLVENDDRRAAVVVTEQITNPTTAAAKVAHRAIARRCGIELRYFRTGGGGSYVTPGRA